MPVITIASRPGKRSEASLDGQVRNYGETWDINGASLRFPGDPLAPIEETAQCRCALSTRLDPI